MRIFIAIVLLLSCAPLCAHDFWIEPSSFQPRAGVISAELRVGEDFKGDPVPRRSSRIESFVVRDAHGERAVAGLENRHPAGVLHVQGPAVIGYQSKLQVHGANERFQRFAKALIGDRDEVLGFRYELIRDGENFRVLYEQKPLANAEVIAMSRDGKRLNARSDADGRVTFPLKKGVWLITSVHYAGDDSLWASLTLSLPSP